MYQTLLGRDGFRRGMDLYFERHDGQAVTCDDFRAAMADANGADLEQFGRWYSQAGTPVLESRGEYDAGRAAPTRSTLAQSCPPTPGQAEKLPFHIPVAVGLVDPQGHDMPLRLEGEDAAHASPDPKTGEITRVFSAHARPSATLVFVDVAEPPVPSILRGLLGAGGAAPRLRRRRAHAPDGARRRPVQPLGGGPGARHAHPARGRRGASRRPRDGSAARLRRGARPRAHRRRARPGVRRRVPAAARARA